MTFPEYQRMTVAQLRGRKVRLLEDLQNHSSIIRAGTIMTIWDKQSGFTLEGDFCQCCGVAARISKVEPHCVALLPVETP